MIVVTGAAGFIASVVASTLTNKGYADIIWVDDFSITTKQENFKHIPENRRVERKHFVKWLNDNANQVQMVIHLGARTDTTEFDYEIHKELNLEYTKDVWNVCVAEGLPLIYASSAATYGLGEFGYEDKHDIVDKLQPLNPYGVSKNEFDIWALHQEKQPFFWAGLKFFNVYGPNEYHKGRMASVIFHAFNQIKATEKMKLFRSHNPDYKDGEQLRDFIYVKDIADIILFLMENRPESGLYNLGTGKAITFNALVEATFTALDKKADISYIDTPADIRDKYQYFTEANMNKLVNAGYDKPFTSLEDGVQDYVQNYLMKNKYVK